MKNREFAILWDKDVTGVEDIKSVEVIREYGDKTVLVDDGDKEFEVSNYDLYEIGDDIAIINYKGDRVKAYVITENGKQAYIKIMGTMHYDLIYLNDIIKYIED